MAVYRLIIEKRSGLNDKFTNVYYVEAAAMGNAVAHGEDISVAEAPLFGDDVDFYNLHVDEVGSASFSNVPLNFNGTLTTSNPIKSFICSKVTWSVTNSYPHYKLYRIQGNSSVLDGINLSTGYQLLLDAFVVYMNSEFAGILCTKTGVILGGAVYSTEYFNLQESKSWYNRTPPTP